MYKVFKYLFDLILSLVLLISIMPLLLLVAILIKINSPGPIFFNQKRLGKDGRLFYLFKFRTMNDCKRDISKQVFDSSEDLTAVGKILRRFKIDELPQVMNVLLGDMSFVGPRPCLPEQLNSFTEIAYYRLKVKPGLTGLAQINGNIYLSWQERWEYDKYYVQNVNFLLDLKIIIKTIRVIFKGERHFLKKIDE